MERVQRSAAEQVAAVGRQAQEAVMAAEARARQGGAAVLVAAEGREAALNGALEDLRAEYEVGGRGPVHDAFWPLMGCHPLDLWPF